MPAKKTISAKGKSSKRTKSSRKSLSERPSQNPGNALTLKPLIRKMKRNPDFARFIHGLLCASQDRDKNKAKAARETLNSYYANPTDDELTALCVPKTFLLQRCTVPTNIYLVAVPAYVLARQRV